MTRNEKVAEKMGWPVVVESCGDGMDGEYYQIAPGHLREKAYCNPGKNIELAHLLIERMVGDGWSVATYHSPTFGHAATARRDPVEFPDAYNVETDDHMPDFPSAVVELFCKVYGIPASE